MEYRRFNDTVVIRMDRGEEILATLKTVCEKENVKLATVSAIGATDEFTVGVLDVGSKKYISNDFKGYYEIVALGGNVNTKNGEYYAHLHMCAADKNGVAVGGHLNRAVISATCEMFVNILDGSVDRKVDEVTGLNIFDFNK